MALSGVKRALTAAVAGVFAAATVPADVAANDTPASDIDRFRAAFETIREQYVEYVAPETLIEAAIAGMLDALDRHSTYLDATALERLETRDAGGRVGIGVKLEPVDAGFRVLDILPGGPAGRAGVRIGDVVTHIDGRSLAGLGLKEAGPLARGPAGSAVTVEVARDEPERRLRFDLVREVTKVDPVSARAEGRAAYVALRHFDRRAAARVEAAVERLARELGPAMTGLVFDLRDNPGGLFGQGVAVADLFLDAGTIVSAKVRGGRGDRRFDARAGDILEGRPIVVLVNGGSASSSEIVAAALQDHGRAVVLGEVSVGKGSIQKLRRLSETSAIKLTFARFHAPSGETIDTRGVIPDVSIEQVASGLRDEGEDDRALRRAVAVLATACAMPEGCSENIRQALATAAPPHERP